MSKEPKIVIIGAGAAGISAACRLFEGGLRDIVILEAKDRIGGRIFTTDFADNVVDLGAQWVHGEVDNIVHDLAKEHKLLESSYNLNDTNRHVFVDATGQLLSQTESSKIWALYYTISNAEEEELTQHEGSHGDFFIRRFHDYCTKNRFTSSKRASEILEWMGKFDNSIQCSDTWFDVSSRGLAEYKCCDGDLLLNWKNRGFKTVLSLLMHEYPNDSNAIPIMEKIRFCTEVKTIDYRNPENIIITTNVGEDYHADNVIFTASLGVLKHQHASLFTPPLSLSKELAINGLNIGTVNKIFLEFPHQWWPENIADFEFLWTEDEKRKFFEDATNNDHWLLEVFGFFTVDYQPRILCGWVTGQAARDMEVLPDSEVKEKLYGLLKKFLSKEFDIPAPVNILRSGWHGDKHFRGSYSFRSLTSERTNVWAKDLSVPILTGPSHLVRW
ncbi:spermine oxidase isoform X2 [Fopius arisanus]|uniref:Spermine oxidase isoform X2 n=1 Tax=Fopius arisanus TaxID=64838 RepID=A0A9R1TLS1_9HYME|nr:PREDICTED: spermine oxidase-like isoform X2 [Fopius arisanus]